MKKTWWLLSAVAALGLTTQVLADGPPKSGTCFDTISCGDDCCPSGGFLGGVELPILKPHIDGQSIQAGETDEDDGLPFTPIRVQPEHEYDLGLRLWGGVMGRNGLGIRARYFGLRSDFARARYLVPEDDDEIDAIEDSRKFEFDTVDLEAVTQFQRGSWMLQLFGGLRYGRVETSFESSRTVYNDDDTDAEQFNSRVVFDGWGPVAGLEVVHRAGDMPVAAFANLRASLLFGETDHRLIAQDIDGQTEFRAEEDNDLVPILEGQVGVEGSYQTQFGLLFARVALEGQIWIEATRSGILHPPGRLTVNPNPQNRLEANDTVGLVGATIGFGIRR